MRLPPIAAAAAALLLSTMPGRSEAGCSVVEMAGQTLTVEEPSAGSWERATSAAHDVLKQAKVVGAMFEQVYLGGYKVQQLRQEIEADDAEFAEKLLLAQDTAAPFQGSCAGDLLAEVTRKAETFRDPERTMVLGVLDGKPLKTSQKTLHDNRERDYLDFERRFLRLVDEASVGAASPPPAPEDTTGGEPGGEEATGETPAAG